MYHYRSKKCLYLFTRRNPSTSANVISIYISVVLYNWWIGVISIKESTGHFSSHQGLLFSPVRPRHKVWPKSPPSDISWHRIVKHNLSSPRPGDSGIVGWYPMFIALLTSNLICIATPTSCLNNFNQNLIRAT